jgi:dTDP-4-amino-4,6-dideoxygalactose transaminase
LRVKLRHLDSWNRRRRQIAELYNREITNPLIEKPAEMSYGSHNYHLYVIRCERRDQLQQHLADRGIKTLIHYPIPIHLQEAYSDLNHRRGDYPVAERCADEVLSLPIFPELSDQEAHYVAQCVNSFS